MAWRVEFLSSASREFEKLAPDVQARIVDFLNERVKTELSPRRMGEALVGKRHKGQWKYRIGHYRLVVRLEDSIMLVTVIRVGHRSAVYR